MTTVGYGDYYPTSAFGYMVGTLCSLTGLILTALPVAVVGTKFNMYWEYSRKRRTKILATLEEVSTSVDKNRVPSRQGWVS